MEFSFRRLITGALLSNFTSGVLFVVLPLMVLKQESGPLLATLIIVTPLLAQTLASFLWGMLSDRLGRRREILVVGALGAAFLYLLFPLVSSPVLLGVRTLQAALLASSTLVTALSSEESAGTVGSRLGRMMMWSNAGSLLGLLLVYPLLTLPSLNSDLGWALVGLLAGATALSAYFLGTAGDLPRRQASAPLGRPFQFAEGSTVLLLSLAIFPLAVGNYIAYSTLPVYLSESLGKGGFFGYPLNAFQQLDLFQIVTAAIAVPYCLWVGAGVDRLRWRRLALIFTPVVYASFWLCYGLTTSYLVFFLVWAIPLYPVLSMAAAREITDLTYSEERGRGIGLWMAVYTLGGLLGGVIAGSLLEGGVAYGSVFLLGSLLAASGALPYALLVTYRLRFNLRGPPSRAPREDGLGDPA